MRGARVICSVPSSPTTTLYAVCTDNGADVRLSITFFGSTSLVTTGGNITGQLDASGPLN
jgi:hypothetical protein